MSLSKKAAATTPAIVGNYLYYLEFTGGSKYYRRIVSYNMKTHKKKYLKTYKSFDIQISTIIDKNRVMATNSKKVCKIYNIKKLK